MKRFLLLTLFGGWLLAALAQSDISIRRVEPANWWTGMKNSSLEILVYGDQIADCEVDITYAGVKLLATHKADNPNYLFLEVEITPQAKPGTLPLKFSRKGKIFTHSFPLLARTGYGDGSRIQGVTAADFVYLLMPDRFANGNPANDKVPGMLQVDLPRDSMYARHGGDLKGIENNLNYLSELGVTALWINPLLENNQKRESYHGYAATDLYRIDPRFGSNDDYVNFVKTCHTKGMKLVWDIVLNHVGTETWWVKDLPYRNWLNQWPEFTRTQYRASTLMDPHASQADRKTFADGWFDKNMPDLNQRDPHLAKYLIQNSLWWIETAGFDGFRVDTYAYPDQPFMTAWHDAVMQEYPRFTIFGETWVQGVPIQSWFTGGTGYKNGISHMPGVTDFQLYYAINSALNEKHGWEEGVTRLYNALTQDFVYANPDANVVFLDNHDLGRFYSSGAHENFDKYKMGIAWLLTTRGIPQLYYGTEILMKNYFDGGNHDKVRLPFPGGFQDGQPNKFLAENRTAQEQEAYRYVQALAQFRKASPAITHGQLMQFIPEDGVYAYFRYTNTHTVMVVMNQNEAPKTIKTSRFAERIGASKTFRDVVTGTTTGIESELTVPAMTTLVLELK